jgi:hypothetical protein
MFDVQEPAWLLTRKRLAGKQGADESDGSGFDE